MISLSRSSITPSPDKLELYANTIFARIRSKREPLERAIDEVIQPRIIENFRSESEAHETKWQALADRTIDERERAGLTGPSPKLQRTTKLMRVASLRRAIWTFTREEARIDPAKLKARAVYALVHQEGWDEKNIPARPYLVINEADAQQIDEIFGDYLMKREVVAALGIGWAAARRAGVR